MATHRTQTFLFDVPQRPLRAGRNVTSDPVLDILTANLTPAQQRLWLALLGGRSPKSIARRLHLSDRAVQHRITGPDGIVARNNWIARWWDARQHQQQQRP
jgi:DNA-binding NarL/FixJ family response regulator